MIFRIVKYGGSGYYIRVLKICLFILHLFLRIPFWILFKIRYRLTYENRKSLPPPGKAFLLLGDHVSYLDPFVIALGLLRPVRWIAADGNFRNPVMGFLMKVIAGAVAKTKNHSDMESLNQMRHIAQTGGIIGLFPEGEMSWDGVSGSMVQGTDKLVRFLKIPVVYCHMEGVYLSRPRWSRAARPRPVTLRFDQIIRQDEIEGMRLGQIRDRIQQAISYNEETLQQKNPQILRSEKRAEGLERVLFTCRNCESINTLVSAGNELKCRECGKTWSVDKLGLLQGEGNKGGCHGWNLWQQRRLAALVESGSFKADEPFWCDESILLYRGRPKKKASLILEGRACFYPDRLSFKGREGQEEEFLLKDITGLNTFKACYVEFLYRKMQYRIDFSSFHSSGEKWSVLYKILLKQWKDPEENEYVR